jgi:GNAT superfamily N-acetyltransferase
VATTFDIAKSGFAVRAAMPADAKACRMLLPAMAGDSPAVVAVDGKRGLVVGAAAIGRTQRPRPLIGPGAMIHVIPPCRRHGIGRALCETLVQLARRQGAQAVYAAQRVEAGGEEMRCWQALGFKECETVLEHELPLAQFAPRLAPLVARLRELGRIPADARIVPLYAADRVQVLQLHLDEMGGDRASLYQKLLGRGPGAYHPRYSRVLLVGERTAGCILAHRKSRYVAAVDANIVIPELRGDWANAWLKLEAAQGAMSLGVTHFHFTSFDQYEDTRAFSKKLGGAATRHWVLMMRALAEPGG